jgi:hypothetical protein
MDPLRSLPGVLGSLQVNERRGGNPRDAETFRRALQQEGGADDGAGQRPVPRPGPLQRAPSGCRKDAGQALHVDVLA